MEFQEKLRSLRKERGETQAQVATAIGIGERHYQKFESGNNLPSFHNGLSGGPDGPAGRVEMSAEQTGRTAMTTYRVPFENGESAFTEKRSRFISHIWRVETEAEARERIEEMKKRYYDARHNCWCYLLQEGGVVRYSDDGEPQGTAGQPMLNVFQRESVTNVCCVVTRYFGGVLLGAGGLTRAYTKGAKDALDAVGISTMSLWTLWDVPCTYPLFERVKLEITACGGVVRDTEYGADIRLRAAFPAGGAELFVPRLTELSAGSLAMEAAGEEFLPGLRESANGT